METALLGKLCAAARAHGEASEPDHEVGDLLGVLASCWERLSESQRRQVYGEHAALVTEWMGG